jgi:hypothetical protein
MTQKGFPHPLTDAFTFCHEVNCRRNQMFHHCHHHQWLYNFVRTLAASHRSFRNLIKTFLGFLWISYQSVAKAPTYAGQHNTDTQRQTSMPRAGFEPAIPVTKRRRPTPTRSGNKMFHFPSSRSITCLFHINLLQVVYYIKTVGLFVVVKNDNKCYFKR